MSKISDKTRLVGSRSECQTHIDSLQTVAHCSHVSVAWEASKNPKLTCATMPHGLVERPSKIDEDRIDFIKAGDDRDNIGARIGVSLRKDDVQIHCQSLISKSLDNYS